MIAAARTCLGDYCRSRNRFQHGLTAVALLFSTYMIYAAIFGPYRTTLVHLAIFLAASFTLYFLRREGTDEPGPLWERALNWLCVAGTLAGTGHVILDLDRILSSWGAAFLTREDIVFGAILVLVVLEAARRESMAFFLLSLAGIGYILYGRELPGILGHPGMDFRRFVYLTAYTSEGIFGFGLEVAASYLFMFLLLSAAMTQTQTGAFIMDLCNAVFGRHSGGPAKSAVAASAGLGTMVGSSIGNVATTGTFTIPLMKRAGMPAHKAGAIETVASEGSQFLPPVMGAGAFIMAEMTGIPYATITLAALIPALLYFLSIFAVVHFEAKKLGLEGLDPSRIPSLRQVFKDGWHLLLPPALLFYLLMGRGASPTYAGMVTILVSIVVAMTRASSRLTFGRFIEIFDGGARAAAGVTALIAAIGFIQQAMVTTGLGPRLSEIILLGTHGSLILTLLLGVVAATVLGMGMPTPIAYVLLALFVAPAFEKVGVPTLAAHLFLFYFAIKSGSTPPVAVVAVVAASIAEANWWKTAVTAFYYSLPGFIVAFMFVYAPALLFQGAWYDIALTAVMAAVGTVAIAAALQGWLQWPLSPIERLAVGVGAVCLVDPGLTTDAIGLCLVGGGVLLARLRAQRSFAST
ncbi:TRAP transporter, 4TM/12TM fusion protein [Tistlia consotensis]|uniref:TRAP transporter, 4TM/12TM fusion protein n=1 Tax=Tistlia consotensis USBA 355 TaxID=560819 RepID=A0A1Y6BYY5_9PROT|nr:TRAP transporter fused permease subunit [Tistlia consotensis]SMF35494.1 TRAP transporter, 4TM/12TM fusion protein [Tistlia consotensis USBA 355]SNR70803.1 TRAP transporter, 4TM/12TM fusion protein [Tistlia consotensis]